VPVEARGRAQRLLLAPLDPGRKHAVEEGLDQGRAEEVLALGPLEFETERLLETGADGLQRRQIDGLDSGECVAGVGREEPRDVLGIT
jgi:hypothetical protein